MAYQVTCLLIAIRLIMHCQSSETVATCTPLYGIRLGTKGIQRVLDAGRCQMVNATTIQEFMQMLPDQIGNRVFDLEIINSTIPVIDRHLFGNVSIRRLRISQSGLRTIRIDGFKGQENVLEELDLNGNELEEIPQTIRNLTVLSHLNLSRNKIRSLPEGTVFFNLLKLRQLNLNYNRLGFLDEVSGHAATNGFLALSLFNLEPLREHLEILKLRSNNMSAFPEQFSRRFSRLQQLDLSDNRFRRIPRESFAQMPQLQELYLDNNNLTTLPKLELSKVLDIFSFRGNQLACDCDAIWLWQIVQNRGTTLRTNLPDCHEPQQYRGLQLNQLAADFCNSRNNNPTKTFHVSQSSATSVDLSASADKIDVRIALAPTNTSEEEKVIFWKITHRKFAEKDVVTDSGFQSIHLSKPIKQSVVHLEPETGYLVCVQVTLLDSTQAQEECREIITLPIKSQLPVKEISVAAGVSTSTTIAVIVLVCCCCPKCKKSKSPSHQEAKTIDTRTLNDKSLLTRSGSSDGKDSASSNNIDTSGHWSSNGPPAFASLRSATSDDENRRTFQATCDYLKNKTENLSTAVCRPKQTGPKLPARNNSQSRNNGTNSGASYIAPNPVPTNDSQTVQYRTIQPTRESQQSAYDEGGSTPIRNQRPYSSTSQHTVYNGEANTPSRNQRRYSRTSQHAVYNEEDSNTPSRNQRRYSRTSLSNSVPVCVTPISATAVNVPYQYYAWDNRPVTWTANTYQHFSANSIAYRNNIRPLPFYAITSVPVTNAINNQRRKTFHWSAAPHMTNMQF